MSTNSFPKRNPPTLVKRSLRPLPYTKGRDGLLYSSSRNLPVILFLGLSLPHMKSWAQLIRRNSAILVWGILLGLNIPAMADHTANVESVRLLEEENGAAIEIIANQPVTPQVTPLDNPKRLVIDLPYSNTSMRGKKIGSHIKQIKDLRVDQYTIKPPVARIVVDLSEAMTFNVDANN